MWTFAFKRLLKKNSTRPNRILNLNLHSPSVLLTRSFSKLFHFQTFLVFLFLWGLSSQTSMKFGSTSPLSFSSEMLNMRKLWPLTSTRNHGGKLKSLCFSLTSLTSGQNLILGEKHRLYTLEAVTKLQGR